MTSVATSYVSVDLFVFSFCLCDIVYFSLNTVIILTSFVWGHHRVFTIFIVMCECAILIQKNYGWVYVNAAIVY